MKAKDIKEKFTKGKKKPEAISDEKSSPCAVTVESFIPAPHDAVYMRQRKDTNAPVETNDNIDYATFQTFRGQTVAEIGLRSMSFPFELRGAEADELKETLKSKKGYKETKQFDNK